MYVGRFDGTLFAIDATSGDNLWQQEVGQVMPGRTVADGVVYAGSFDRNLYALEAESGGIIRTYASGAGIIASPDMADDVVACNNQSRRLFAVEAVTGEQL